MQQQGIRCNHPEILPSPSSGVTECEHRCWGWALAGDSPPELQVWLSVTQLPALPWPEGILLLLLLLEVTPAHPEGILLLEVTPAHPDLWIQALSGSPGSPEPLGQCLGPVRLGIHCAWLLWAVSPGVLALESFCRRFILQ